MYGTNKSNSSSMNSLATRHIMCRILHAFWLVLFYGRPTNDVINIVFFSQQRAKGKFVPKFCLCTDSLFPMGKNTHSEIDRSQMMSKCKNSYAKFCLTTFWPHLWYISATLHNRQPIHWTIRFILHVWAEHQRTIMKKYVYRTVAFTEVAVTARDNKTYLELSNQ